MSVIFKFFFFFLFTFVHFVYFLCTRIALPFLLGTILMEFKKDYKLKVLTQIFPSLQSYQA